MTEYNKMQMSLDKSGLVELCDVCGTWIFDERFRRRAFIREDGKICCEDCKKVLTTN